MSDKHNRLLVIDDEEIILEMLRDLFAREDAIQSFYASSAEQALKIFVEEDIDVVLTDVKMPGKNGIELLQQIKKIRPSSPVIIMSGYADTADVIVALREGVTDFFQKPFKLQTVIDCIHRIFQRLNAEHTRNRASQFLVCENRVFRIPNDFTLAHQLTLELTKNLVEKRIADDVFIESIRVALNEMLINALEHGNLEISYEEKHTRIDEFDQYTRFVQERARDPRFRDRQVEIEYALAPDKVEFVITDEGPGFDHRNLPDPTNPDNLLSAHGRGILMARIYMDQVVYNDKGNQVRLVKFKPPNGTGNGEKKA